jgi:hypothetical protein
MKMKPALLIIGGATLFLGCTNFIATALQERVITCETQLNSNQLALIITMQQYASNETKIAQFSLAKQLERATGVPGPISDEHAKLFQVAKNLNQRAINSNNQMGQLLEGDCIFQRSQWLVFSLLLIAVNSLIACVAFWLGIRVADAQPLGRESPRKKRNARSKRLPADGLSGGQAD